MNDTTKSVRPADQAPVNEPSDLVAELAAIGYTFDENGHLVRLPGKVAQADAQAKARAQRIVARVGTGAGKASAVAAYALRDVPAQTIKSAAETANEKRAQMRTKREERRAFFAARKEANRKAKAQAKAEQAEKQAAELQEVAAKLRGEQPTS